MWPVLLIFWIFVHSGSSQVRVSEITVIPYQIAGVFENVNTQLYAFNESMRHATHGEFKVQPIIIQPSRRDSYSMWREMCANKAMRPIAVVGPQNPTSDGAIRDQLFIANIPHIQATWQPVDPDEEISTISNEEEEDDRKPTFKKITINFYPHSDGICDALAKLLKYYSWKSFAVLYEDDFGLMRIQKILADYTDKYPITVRRLDPEGSNHKIFKELVSQNGRVIMDCHVNNIEKYLDEAKEMNMVDHYQHYIFTSLDTSTIAERLAARPCNSSWLSFMEYDKSTGLEARVGKWSGFDPTSTNKIFVKQFELEALIMDDIANHVVNSFMSVKKKPQSTICGQDSRPWQHGAKLQNQILKTKTVGVTGNIEFDERGRRFNYTLYANEIHNNMRRTIGKWESANSTSINETRSTLSQTFKQTQASKEFKIISKRTKPYFYEKEKCEGDTCVDNYPDEKYEGFAVDLVREIFKYLQKERFNYTYKFIEMDNEDEGYGKFLPKENKWNGMIGYLLDKKADLAVCDFTITEERKKVIDFSVPFMSLGISILYVKEHKRQPETFSFLNPYTFDVWMYTATAYCGVSIVLYVCARISPADWENPEPCDKDPEELENIWTFNNCAWLTWGSIMTQGCDILPKALGTRWICGMWWFFTMIVCQTYIAQLSASMTSALENEPINSVDDLAKQTKILYGAYKLGSTLEFFRSSKDKMYHQMYENMISNPVVLVGSNDEGEKRVLRGKGKYAFFMESSTIDYKLKRNCDLKKVGDELDSKDYGIAMPANSPFRSDINRAILRLKELTILDEIKNTWWDTKFGAIDCPSGTNADDVEGDLEMENLIGLFVVLVFGLIICIFITAAEFFNEVRNIVVREQLSHKEAFVQELKASLNFFQLQKPVLRNPSRAPSIDSSKNSSEKRERRSAAIENFMDMEKEVQ